MSVWLEGQLAWMELPRARVPLGCGLRAVGIGTKGLHGPWFYLSACSQTLSFQQRRAGSLRKRICLSVLALATEPSGASWELCFLEPFVQGRAAIREDGQNQLSSMSGSFTSRKLVSACLAVSATCGTVGVWWPFL